MKIVSGRFLFSQRSAHEETQRKKKRIPCSIKKIYCERFRDWFWCSLDSPRALKAQLFAFAIYIFSLLSSELHTRERLHAFAFFSFNSTARICVSELEHSLILSLSRLLSSFFFLWSFDGWFAFLSTERDIFRVAQVSFLMATHNSVSRSGRVFSLSGVVESPRSRAALVNDVWIGFGRQEISSGRSWAVGARS